MPAADLPPLFVRVLAFAFGSLWGSFFNVAIHRWPREMSVVTPPSHCPSCGAPIAPYRNVPILGYLLLRGRAACCGARISSRYFFVELLSALLCLALAERLIVHAPPGTSVGPAMVETLIYFFFVGGLIVATFVDLEWMEIPDEVSLPGAALGLLTVELREAPGAVDAALGAGIGFLGVQLIFVWSYERLFGRRGMGEGDSKLLMMIGAFLGWQGVLFSVVAGSLQGIVGYVIATVTGRDLVPEPLLEADDSPPSEAGDPADGGGSGTRGTEGSGGADRVEGDPSRRGDGQGSKENDAGSEESDGGEDGEEEARAPRVPFGPFLALAALEYLFFGPAIVDWYFHRLMGH